MGVIFCLGMTIGVLWGVSIIDPDDTVWRNFKLEWVNVKRRQKKYIGLCVNDMLLCKTLINGCRFLSGYDCWCFAGVSIIDPDDNVWSNFKLEWVNVKRRQKKYIGLCVNDMLLCKTLINGCPVLSGYT